MTRSSTKGFADRDRFDRLGREAANDRCQQQVDNGLIVSTSTAVTILQMNWDQELPPTAF